MRLYVVASDTFSRSAAWSTSIHGLPAGNGVRGRAAALGFCHWLTQSIILQM